MPLSVQRVDDAEIDAAIAKELQEADGGDSDEGSV